MLSQFLIYEGKDTIVVSSALIRLLHLYSNVIETQVVSSQVSALTKWYQRRNAVFYVPSNTFSCSKNTDNNMILAKLSEIEK